ncbi:MAG TPA: 2Fe-2S ferredoxin [Cyanobacteria bacterium UBA8530]|nr:2Fe-2S ferredoxin [Cyanobacteria bacterium UBA8530]
MASKITLEDLKRIKSQAAQSTALREGEQTTKIVVHMGTCGIASGAREIMTEIMRVVAEKNLAGVTVAHASCIGLCDREPILTIEKPNEKVRYGNVKPEMVKRILEEHVIGDRMIADWIIKGA